jgi:hypothetical protein
MFHLGTLYQGATVPPDAEVGRIEVLYQGMACRGSRRQVFVAGVALVVPDELEKRGALAPAVAKLESVL